MTPPMTPQEDKLTDQVDLLDETIAQATDAVKGVTKDVTEGTKKKAKETDAIQTGSVAN